MAAENGVSLMLEGEVSLDELAIAARALKTIVAGLAKESEPGESIQWFVGDLKKSSVDITAAGYAETAAGMRAVRATHDRWEDFGEDVRAGRIDRYSPSVRHAVNDLRRMLNGRIPGMRFRRAEQPPTDGVRIVAEPPRIIPPSAVMLQSFGVLRGKVVGLSQRGGGPVLVIEVPVWGTGVVCHVPKEDIDSLGEHWNKYVAVRGIITRESYTGRPISISQARVEQLNPSTGSIVDAQGCLSRIGNASLDDTIDGWWDG